MKAINLENVKSQNSGGGVSDIQPGGYICRIMMVQDFPDKEYLRVDLDIAAGEFKGYYQDLAAKFGFWGATQYWSYKDKNLGYFKGNIAAVEESNTSYKFSPNEQELVGKLVGAVFGEEEYKTKMGEIRCNVKPRYVCSAQRIMDKKYKVPKRKEYKEREAKPAGGSYWLEPLMADASDEKLPWED